MGKGRNKNLIKKRDEALVKRYHYWTEVQRLRFDDALKILSETEFFISEERILSVIRAYATKIDDISIKPVKKVKMPKITRKQLDILTKPVQD